ncbi:peptidoglycan editing factor PgeF [Hydrogenophaga sp. PAMC20947]|uniref:peptidoglycan editing factor PgeF n=1 Tax=Hydrogenophaga sp. PAMC20947 TaxID=2565558 RepID=UPI00109D91C8|nr:peptidoglycan editing factor PgeF [Hydrogenophaga sp. PAMC20947]QCB45743.1 peptidoglycan editing factor PgeF [Hydrogenophaga sp. PAMC20947]
MPTGQPLAHQLTPEWSAPAGVLATFTLRGGGVSAPPFDSFNLGDHVRDDPAAVAHNRQQLGHTLGAHPVFLQQVHGTGVVTLQAQTPDGAEGDACITTQPGLACTIMVADCLPVLFTHRSGTVVAAAHAGWRGLAGDAQGRGVLETTLDAVIETVCQQQPGLTAAEVVEGVQVWLGPCIGPSAFEVGAEVRQAFVERQPEARACFSEALESAGVAGKWMGDLAGLARQRLQARGVVQIDGNDSSAAWCTVENNSRFFSHRRDAVRLGSTGRMAACIWIA